MQGIHASALLADKGCDADVLLAWLNERQVIERMLGKLKYFRRIATRFEKKASHFNEVLAFAAVLL